MQDPITGVKPLFAVRISEAHLCVIDFVTMSCHAFWNGFSILNAFKLVSLCQGETGSSYASLSVAPGMPYLFIVDIVAGDFLGGLSVQVFCVYLMLVLHIISKFIDRNI